MEKENENLLPSDDLELDLSEPTDNTPETPVKEQQIKENAVVEKSQPTPKKKSKGKGVLIGLSIFSGLALAGGGAFFAYSTININNTVSKKYEISSDPENCQLYIRDKDKNIVNNCKANTELEIEVSGIKTGYTITEINILNTNKEKIYSVLLDDSKKCSIVSPNYNIIVSAHAKLDEEKEHNLYYFGTTPGIFSLVFKNSNNETITSATEGEKVIIDYNITTEYTLEKVYMNGTEISKASSGKYEFEMPASDVVVEIQTSKIPETTFTTTFRLTQSQAQSGVTLNDDIMPISQTFTQNIQFKDITNKPTAKYTNNTFIGWTNDPDKVEGLIATTHIVQSSETYYPYFVPDDVKIDLEFKPGDKGTITASLTVAEGQKVETVEIPNPEIKEEYKTTHEFNHWSWTDPSTTDTPIQSTDEFNTSDHKTLYAVYTEK